MKIDVIIPVYRPTEKLNKVLYGLSRQTYLPERIILLHTRDGIKLDVSACKDRVSVTEIPIPEKEFDHGRTRDLGIRMSDADIVVMMTQDAVPVDSFLLEKLSETLKEHSDAVAAYARQIPDQNCGLLEKYTRVFNYPPKSQIKSQKDLPKLGIKTYFCSNVCAAYRRGVYLELGGFPHPVIFNEDLIFAARTLGMSEWSIFFRVMIPNALPGIISGGVLAFARGLGEFGATAMIAGNIRGKTRTLPLAVYSAVASGKMDDAGQYVVILVGISFIVVVCMNYFSMERKG